MPRRKREKPFHKQIVWLNSHISARKLKGDLRYFEIPDLREVYDEYKGQCAYCGIDIVSGAQKLNTVHFIFRIPLEMGGMVDKGNIIPVCYRCKEQKKPKKPPERPIFEYNAFSDIVVQLVQSVIEKDKEKAKYFKSQLEYGLQDYIQTLYYRPLGLPPRSESTHSVSDIIIEVTKELEKTLKLGTFTKDYRIERKCGK